MKMIYNVEDRPPFGKTLIFALQQVLAILAATIAVPAIIGNDMSASAALFGAGVGTIIYLLFTRFKSPVFLGSSFAFIGSMFSAFAGGVSMSLGYFGLIIGAAFAGLVYVVLAIVVKAVGVKWINKLMPAVVIGPTVAIIGLSLAGNAVGDLTTGKVFTADGAQAASPYLCLLCGLVTLFVTMICSVYGKKMLKMIPFIIGIVSGLLVVFGVWFLDYVLRVDDPVGAVAVHCLNGIWGTIAVGLFATTSAPGNDDLVGLFYGGGFTLLGKQLIGFAAVASWTVVTITITFLVIRAVVGLRVTEEEEIVGLDAMEHGLASAYSGFSIMDVSNTMMMDVNENTNLGTDDYKAASDAQKNAAVKVVKAPAAADTGMYKVVIISKLSRYDKLRKAMNDLGVTGMTVTQVMGCGVQKGAGEKYRGVEIDATLLPKVKVEVVVSSIPVDQVIEAAKKVLYTGHIGDGKIFVYNVDRVVKVRTGEEDTDALQDVE